MTPNEEAYLDSRLSNTYPSPELRRIAKRAILLGEAIGAFVAKYPDYKYELARIFDGRGLPIDVSTLCRESDYAHQLMRMQIEILSKAKASEAVARIKAAMPAEADLAGL